MINEPADDQYAIDYFEIDTHAPVTSETVSAAITILGLTDYELLCEFLEPTEDEKRIIRDTLKDYQLPDYC